MRTATKQVLGKPAKQVAEPGGRQADRHHPSRHLGQSDPNAVTNTRGFVLAECVIRCGEQMSRMYVVEGGYTITGATADSRLALRPSQMPAFLSELERRSKSSSGGETHDHDERGSGL